MMSGREPDRKAEGIARRDFLRTAGVGAIAGVGATMIGGVDGAEADSPTPAAKGRYRESDHVRQVYDLARF